MLCLHQHREDSPLSSVYKSLSKELKKKTLLIHLLGLDTWMNLDKVQSELRSCNSTSRTALRLVFCFFYLFYFGFLWILHVWMIWTLHLLKLLFKVPWHFILVVRVWQCAVKVIDFNLYVFFVFPWSTWTDVIVVSFRKICY